MSIYPLRPPTRLRNPRYAVVLPVLALIPIIAGCGGGDGDPGSGGGGDTTPPQVVWARFEPSTVAATGGTAKVQAQVTDPSGVSWVRATVTRPDGTQSVLEMSWQSAGFYQASFSVPMNLDGDSLYYSATVSACDSPGNVTSPLSVGTLTVGGDSGPPPPPNL